MAKRKASARKKYDLYEASVQSPEWHIDWAANVYKAIRGKFARHFREDFCGTFALSCAWVKRNRANRATAIDLDPEPLKYGKREHFSKLNPDQKKRTSVVRGDVMDTRASKADLILVGNFSFFIFKQRDLLMKYLRASKRNLADDGMLILEMAGGPGMISKDKDRRTIRLKGKQFTYIWDQVSFDPITHDAQYAIHFRFPDGKRPMNNAFTYDWRLWTIPEVRDALIEAGFKKTVVYWDTRDDGDYIPAETGDNAYSWIAQIVALK